MDQDLLERLVRLEKKVDAVYGSVEKTRQYFLGLLILSGIAFVLPLIGLLFAVPSFLSLYQGLSQF